MSGHIFPVNCQPIIPQGIQETVAYLGYTLNAGPAVLQRFKSAVDSLSL